MTGGVFLTVLTLFGALCMSGSNAVAASPLAIRTATRRAAAVPDAVATRTTTAFQSKDRGMGDGGTVDHLSMRRVLSVPRGGGPVDPSSAAKVIGSINLVHGAYCALSPRSNFEAYGMRGASPTNFLLMRRVGLIVLQLGIGAYTLLFKHYGINTFFSLIGLVWMAEVGHALLNNMSEITGPAKASDLHSLFVSAITVYGALNNTSWARTAYKVNAIYFLIAGLTAWFSPIAVLEAQAMKGADRCTAALVERFGAKSLIAGTLQWSLACGYKPVDAFGYAFAIAVPVTIKTNFLSSDFAVLGIDRSLRLFWPVLFAAGAADILLE